MRTRLFLLLALIVAVAGGCTSEPPQGVERVILLGVDGLDERVLDDLIERGSVPHLARFFERGISGELETLLPTYSPRIWASVATGKLPDKHGISGFAQRGPDHKRVPFTANARRVKALWNVVGDAGKRVAVVGWWTTWPAESVNGVMISDRMLYNRFNLWLGLAHHGADLPAQTHPPELFDELVDVTRVPDTLEAELLARFGPNRPPGPIEQSLHDPWYELFLVHARDRAYRDVLDRVMEREPFDLVAYYVNGADIASHYFWKYRYPEEWTEKIDPAEQAEREGVIERYYSYVDESLAPLLELADERTLVIVVSDHGFITGARGDSPNISGIHFNAAPPGVIAMAGGGIPAGARLGRAAVADVAPTVLHALGLPVARDMDGTVLPASPTWGDVAYVETYETGAPGEGNQSIPTEHDEAILEKLEALGYIGSR